MIKIVATRSLQGASVGFSHLPLNLNQAQKSCAWRAWATHSCFTAIKLVPLWPELWRLRRHQRCRRRRRRRCRRRRCRRRLEHCWQLAWTLHSSFPTDFHVLSRKKLPYFWLIIDHYCSWRFSCGTFELITRESLNEFSSIGWASWIRVPCRSSWVLFPAAA